MSDSATKAQIQAARPDVSTWLAANAGSGKTRVLTNRVARLLLHGVEPQNILCLTYTKAAASEMQNRLFATLGAWAMLNDAELIEELGRLGEPKPEDLPRARTLFASAVEAPGGLKIQTIHSFCSTILRQFPLEAGVNPQFRELDDAALEDVLAVVIEDVASSEKDIFRDFADLGPSEDLPSLVRDIVGKRSEFAKPRTQEAVYRSLGAPFGKTTDNVLSDAVSEQDIAFLKSLVPILRMAGKPTDLKLADLFEHLPANPVIGFERLEAGFLTKEGTPRKSQPTKPTAESPAFAPLLPQFNDIKMRVEKARSDLIAMAAAQQACALQAFAGAFLPRYARAKSDRGFLDFDDLILKTRDLFSDQTRRWVMYRLDSRIEHILVDEAQDTSPAQWDIIGALTEELAAGESDRLRTLFVVGDKKQSIYSFQGADSAEFDARAERFREQKVAGRALAEGALLHSFRSSPAILETVDRVFSEKPAGVGQGVAHQAFHLGMPGRVDVWPLVPRPEKSDPIPWHDTRSLQAADDPNQVLAQSVAFYIKTLLETGTIPGKNGQFRRVRAGDILLLVQRRSHLFDKLIAELKAHDLDVAGADRLKVSAELAVRDLLALLSFLSLPEDSLALATALRSPLFGWSEQDLYALAADRPEGEHLWQTLRARKDAFGETYAMLEALRGKVDYLRPFELLETILGTYDGRKKLLARLGKEAEDGIEELANQALAYERQNVPSLTGFIAASRSSEQEIKRESDSSGNLIRVMTVHGAKGLESPIVILPDTTFAPKNRVSGVLVTADGLPVIPQSREQTPPVIAEAKAQKLEADAAERDRLLYVAMTRAEKWLITCGVEPASASETNWHAAINGAASSMESAPLDTPFGPGLRVSTGVWDAVLPDKATSTAQVDIQLDLPNIPKPKEPPVVWSPSDLGGAKALAGDYSENTNGRQRGQQIHLLLEHLPGAKDPMKKAHALLEGEVDAEALKNTVTHCLSVIEKQATVFAESSLAEVDIVADIPVLGGRISGTIDRLIIEEQRILAVDFKSNSIVPKTAEETPEAILRQMGAYLAALEQIYPDRKVEVAVLWTATGLLMPLTHGIVRAALARTPTS